MADSKSFILKGKPIIYIGAFIELYNKKNSGPLYEIQKMVRFKKMYALTTRIFIPSVIIGWLRYLLFYILLILSLKIITNLCFMSITILIVINSANYMILIR